ncbi:hypothetical protein DP42_3151 [Burkholderia pseudomallei]|nr:hypothetical protein DP42_3151 [Burkholderia pseudomallei]
MMVCFMHKKYRKRVRQWSVHHRREPRHRVCA